MRCTECGRSRGHWRSCSRDKTRCEECERSITCHTLECSSSHTLACDPADREPHVVAHWSSDGFLQFDLRPQHRSLVLRELQALLGSAFSSAKE